ncbi:hypothetical protein GCM10008986_27030 [Salinibacillus aidingensis]|uniref:Poly (Glycerol-phosphate) alpha-glucosyltransferase n=1 Tax=Salinibacillus aidingensis TaxID=237684 RepID=A0ABN1BIX1_9BACI
MESVKPSEKKQSFRDQADRLYMYIRTSDFYHELVHYPSVHVFLTVGFQHRRATVLHVNKTGFEETWKALVKQAEGSIHQTPDYLKADIVTHKKPIDILSFIDLITKTKKNYFRFGVSLDRSFRQAFLEQEVNGNAMIQFDSRKKRGYLKEVNIQNYIKKHRPDMKPVDFRKVTNLYLFSTKGFFMDDKRCYELKDTWLDNGRRDTGLDGDEIHELVTSGQTYLTSLNQDNGKFIYGYFACFDKEIHFYNMLRHASTVYSMIEAYEFNSTAEAENAIKRALQFLKTEGIYFADKQRAYVVDGPNSKNKEIKLGANAAAILALTKYTEVFGDDRYMELAQSLAKGMRSLQNEDGSFVHVLQYPSLTIKEKFRIVYYDGEAALAFMRLYKLDKDPQWLAAVEKAFDYFIHNQYWKHHDHWLSYCTNDLTIYRPEERYFEFGLKNTKDKLSFIEKRETTYPTFLELTIAAYQMIKRMKEQGYDHLLDSFDEEYLESVIHKRAEYQRNGFFYPELAIYYKNPARITGSFFIRHHSFRTRIDDIEHYLSGYIAYYQTFMG